MRLLDYSSISVHITAPFKLHQNHHEGTKDIFIVYYLRASKIFFQFVFINFYSVQIVLNTLSVVFYYEVDFDNDRKCSQAKEANFK